MSITLTEKATQELRRVMDENQFEEGTFFRIGVQGGGCSGLSYDLRFDNQYNDQSDMKYNFFGLDVVVDRKSLMFLDGTTMDWYEGVEKRGFTFNNPNATKTCGCGTSFQA